MDFEDKDYIQPLCPYFGKCGGCSLMNIAYKAQVREKLKYVSGLVHSVSPDAEILEPVTGPSEGYRSRARFRLSKEGFSFYEEHSNNSVIIKSCPVLDSSLNVFIKNPPKINLWELEDGQLSCITTDKGVLYDSRDSWITIGNKKLPVSNSVFFQSNLILLPKLIDYVVSNVQGPNVMDLYAGVGTFSAFLEDKYNVTAVEINRKCLSLAHQHLKNTEFFTSPVERFKSKKKNINTVIVDPPRVGLENNVPKMISSWKPEQIIYVSCYAPTMIRDIKRFTKEGYKILSVKLFDFYPHTPHVETVVLMSRGE